MADTTLFERTETMNAHPKQELVEQTLSVTAPSLMEIISHAARDKDVDVNKLEKLLQLANQQGAQEAERAFNVAMNEVQTAIRPIAADASNPQTKSKYASYLALDKALRPIYTSHGFSLSFDTGDAAENIVRVLCYVSHKDGHSRTYRVDMPADGKGAKGGDVMTKTHATGAAMTYGQRYLLKMIFNIAVGDDDDGNGVGTGQGPITDAQFETIQELIAKFDADPQKFCAAMKVSAVNEIKAKDYGTAIEKLNSYGADKAKRAKAGT